MDVTPIVEVLEALPDGPLVVINVESPFPELDSFAENDIVIGPQFGDINFPFGREAFDFGVVIGEGEIDSNNVEVENDITNKTTVVTEAAADAAGTEEADAAGSEADAAATTEAEATAPEAPVVDEAAAEEAATAAEEAVEDPAVTEQAAEAAPSAFSFPVNLNPFGAFQA